MGFPRLGWIILAILLLSPYARAAGDTLDISSSEPIGLDGMLTVHLPHGSAFIDVAIARGESTLTVTVGHLQLYTWDEATVRGNVQRVGDVRTQNVDLVNATLRLAWQDEPFAARLRGEGLGAHGEIDTRGHPTVLDTPFTLEVAPSPFPSAPTVPIAWERSWRYVGNAPYPGLPHAPFPTPSTPLIVLEGGLEASFFGGTLTHEAENGTREAWKLGEVRSQGAPDVGLRTVRRAVLIAETASGALPAIGTWGAAAATSMWRIDGTAEWTHATGQVERDGTTTRFVDEGIDVKMRGVLAVATPDGPLEEGTRTRGAGEVALIRIDGRPVAEPATNPALPVALTLAAALLLLASQWGQTAVGGAIAAYTRIARSRLLDHPARREIHDLVTARPGIHMRELHRIVGGAWGPFTFHLRMLERGGHLTVQVEGRYRRVLPPGASLDAATPAHPIAHQLLTSLPKDGSPVPVSELARRIGISRELARYHAKGLETSGHAVRVSEGPLKGGLARVDGEAADPPEI